jgi:hypothetical protein
MIPASPEADRNIYLCVCFQTIEIQTHTHTHTHTHTQEAALEDNQQKLLVVPR